MDLIKGIDRIALVIAILSLPIGYIFGTFIFSDVFVTKNPAYDAWILEREKGSPEPKKLSDGRVVLSFDLRPYNPPPMYLPQSKSQITVTFLAAFALSLLCFLSVLYGIRYGTRGTKWFTLWIIDGFKD